MDAVARGIEGVTTLLAVCGLAYYLVALWSARSFACSGKAQPEEQPPGVSILKPMKGHDPGIYAGLVSHCIQNYSGEYEIIFGVGSLQDPAVAAVHQLQQDFPQVKIRVVECPLRLGTSGKVSNLAQMLPHATHRHLVVNDSDILVSPNYLANIMAGFGASASGRKVGLVTAPYIGHTGAASSSAGAGSSRVGIWSKMEALGISTDFLPGVLTARKIEGGIRFGLGSTLAFTREALSAIGGLEPLADYLADDYELGARIAAKGYEVVLSREVVATSIPAYSLRGFWEHQLRWARSTRDSRKLGYLGLLFTFGLPWAILNCVASGFALWSFSLLSVVLFARVAVALIVGVGILRDEQVLRDLWLLPLRDVLALLLWAWSYADDIVIWRGEKFHLRNGKLARL
ncbi:MAG: bacteriohopanetetrol glucosamine biosynthesis glycosyltransferase HpnI [Acidobacteriaceae bacterium]